MPCSHLGAHIVICLPWKNCGPRRDRLDRVSQSHRYPNRGLRRWLWGQPREELRMLDPELVHAPVLFQMEAPGKGGPTYLSCHHLASAQARSWGQSSLLGQRLCVPLFSSRAPQPLPGEVTVSATGPPALSACHRAPARPCLVPSKPTHCSPQLLPTAYSPPERRKVPWWGAFSKSLALSVCQSVHPFIHPSNMSLFGGIILGPYLLASCGSQHPGFSSQCIESTRLALLLALYGHQASDCSSST